MSFLLTPKRYPQRPPLKKQEGVVIVVALFFVALVATMSYIMIARLDRDISRTTLILRYSQAELYAQGSIAWALDTLHENFLNKKNDKPVDPVPFQSPVSERNGYRIQSTIYDMQGRFNINSLINLDAQNDFKRLAKISLPDFNEETLNALTANILEWLKPDANETMQSRYYIGLPLPYRSAHRAMHSISELRLVKGMTPMMYKALKDHLIALPEHELPINIQTATLPVLMTLSPEMTIDAAKMILAMRSKKPFTSVDVIYSAKLYQFKIPKNKITVVSHYFLIKTEVTIENQQTILYSLVARLEKNADSQNIILWQSKNLPG